MSGNELLTDDELAAAFAEIESTGGDSIPDLDDGQGSDDTSQVVAVVNSTEPEFEAAPFEADASAAGEDPVAHDGLMVDEFASPEAVAALQAEKEVEEAPKPRLRLQIDLKGLLGQVNARAYDAVDATLRLVDRPFARLDEPVRKLIALGSLVTIGMSILVIVLAPLLIRGKTPMEFLHEKSASLPSSVMRSVDSDEP